LESTRKLISLLITEFFLQICLDINDTNEYDYADSDVFDLPEQNLIREDVLRLVRKYKIILEALYFNLQGTSKINQDVAASKMSDTEAVITFYCKKK
jgi:hypothetical protein